MKLSRRRILVTGGAGFIGSHLCTHLANENNHVICLDNFQSGSKSNISHLLNEPNFELIEHDIIEPFDLIVDEIFNLACVASPQGYQFNPIHTTKTNVIGSLNLLELATKLNAPIFQASTSEVYGDPLCNPQHESYWGNVNPIGKRACYDEGKRCAESLFFDYHRQFNTNIKVARIFNTYGPKMAPNDGRVIPNFIFQALQNKPLTIYGDGSQTRSFCYIDDLIGGILKLTRSKLKVIEPINLGNTEEISVLTIANTIIEMTNSLSKIEFFPLPENDPKQRKPDISKAKNKIDWEPKINLQIGLVETIKYFKCITT